jgi:hypothetical protein
VGYKRSLASGDQTAIVYPGIYSVATIYFQKQRQQARPPKAKDSSEPPLAVLVAFLLESYIT